MNCYTSTCFPLTAYSILIITINNRSSSSAIFASGSTKQIPTGVAKLMPGSLRIWNFLARAPGQVLCWRNYFMSNWFWGKPLGVDGAKKLIVLFDEDKSGTIGRNSRSGTVSANTWQIFLNLLHCTASLITCKLHSLLEMQIVAVRWIQEVQRCIQTTAQ